MAMVGCGGGSGGYTSVSLDQLPQVYSKVLCDQNFKCASAADIMFMDHTKEDCLNTNQGIFQLVVPEIRGSVNKGRSTYDATKAGSCFTALQNQSCDDWVKGTVDPPVCDEVITPKVALGGACGQDGDCIGGYCDGADTTADPPKDGVCKATIPHGGTCTAADTCADDDVCDTGTMTCVSKKAGGEPCTSDSECSNSCNTDTMKCSGYAGCSVAPVTTAGTLGSLLALALVVGAAGRRRRRR
jgi:MYXO-CTERM domain-containing protein